jgi:hypothetical protein
MSSIPTAPTNKITSKIAGSERFRRSPFFMPESDYSEKYRGSATSFSREPQFSPSQAKDDGDPFAR